MTEYLVVWWMGGGRDCPTCGLKREPGAPYYAVFGNLEAAEAAAHVRNGIMATVEGRTKSVVDWYRRDEKGRPMPAEPRELQGTRLSVGPRMCSAGSE